MSLSVRNLTALPFFLLLSCRGSDGALGPADDHKKAEEAEAFSTQLSRIDLGTLGGGSSYAADVNDVGVVVGWSELQSGATHAFRWSRDHGMVDLGTLPGDESSRAVSLLEGSGGDALGMSGRDGHWQPVIWSSSGQIRKLSIPLSPSFAAVVPTGFNARGEVVGSEVGAGQRGWVWSEAAGKYDLSANLPSGSLEGSAAAVTGSGLVLLTSRAATCTHNPSCWRAYTWARGAGYRALDVPEKNGEASVVGLGMSDGGSVVGWTSTEQSSVAPYRWVPGRGFTSLDHYDGSTAGYGYATAVASTGIAVGADLDPGSRNIVASAWLANGAIARLSPDNPSPSVAVAINETGMIAGWSAVTGGVNHATVWSYSANASAGQLRVLSGFGAAVSTASAPCLRIASTLTSRRSLFDCAAAADRAKLRARSAD